MGIYTVRGKIDNESLGFTYAHEHMQINLSKIKGDDDTNFNDVDAVIEEMKVLKSLGVKSIIDVTNRGMGRDLEKISHISEQSGINVILCTGFYKEPYLPSECYEGTTKAISSIMINELMNGIEDSGIKAHLIGEIGSSKDVMTPVEEKIFTAAARASLETGAPITTHTTLGTFALEQIKLFEQMQVNLRKVIIGHLDLKCDRDYHLRIADKGVNLAFDTIGKLNYESDEVRAQHIVHLIERGHLGQVILSQDITRKSHLKRHGGIGYQYLVESFLPMLLKMGVSEAQIKAMTIENPLRILNRGIL